MRSVACQEEEKDKEKKRRKNCSKRHREANRRGDEPVENFTTPSPRVLNRHFDARKKKTPRSSREKERKREGESFSGLLRAKTDGQNIADR